MNNLTDCSEGGGRDRVVFYFPDIVYQAGQLVLVVIVFFMSVVLLKEKEREKGGFCKYQDASILIALSWSAF